MIRRCARHLACVMVFGDSGFGFIGQGTVFDTVPELGMRPLRIAAAAVPRLQDRQFRPWLPPEPDRPSSSAENFMIGIRHALYGMPCLSVRTCPTRVAVRVSLFHAFPREGSMRSKPTTGIVPSIPESLRSGKLPVRVSHDWCGGRNVSLRQAAANGICRVHQVAYPKLAALRDKLVSVGAIPTCQLRKPKHHSGRGNSHCVLEWPRATDNTDMGIGLDSGPAEVPVDGKAIDDQGCRERPLHRGAGDFAIALGIVAVAKIQVAAIDIGSQVERGARARDRAGRDSRRIPLTSRSDEPRHGQGPHLPCRRKDEVAPAGRLPEAVGARTESPSSEIRQIQTRSLSSG